MHHILFQVSHGIQLSPLALVKGVRPLKVKEEKINEEIENIKRARVEREFDLLTNISNTAEEG